MNLSRGSICVLLLIMLMTALVVCPALGDGATAEPETVVTEEPLDFSSRALTGQRIPWDVTVMPNVPHAKAYLPDNAGYQDTSLDIRVETTRRDDTDIMLVYVRIADPTQLRCTTPTTRLAGRSLAPVSAMAKNVNAVLAINGDYYSYHSDGIVIRNGERFREKPNKGRDTLIIDDKGDFTILAPTTPEAYETFEGNIIHAFCFGPGLVVDGQPLTSLDAVELDVGKNKKTQRIAIGQLDHLSYLIVTTEGPENKGSVGFDLLQMAALCKELGCVNAYNLDGGSSSTIVLNNEKINALSSKKIRSVGDCIFFATLEP